VTERGRALLINALVFPGMGQLLVLGRRRVGALLVAGSLLALLAYGVLLVQELSGALLGFSAGGADPRELLGALFAVLTRPGRGAVLALLALLTFWVLALLEVLCGSVRGAASRRPL